MPTEFNKIRAASFVIINHNNKTLVSPGYDRVKDKHFHRLIGGGIEFGETSLEALAREIKEELGLELKDYKLLDVNENIFVYNGEKAHEICFIYQANFVDEENYNRESIQVLDEPSHQAIWLDINEENLKKIMPENSYLLFN